MRCDVLGDQLGHCLIPKLTRRRNVGTVKILIVGASGYIGSRVSLELSDMAHQLVGCDRRPSVRSEDFVSFLQESYSDLSDQTLSTIDVVIWLAGHSTVGMSVDDPEGCLNNNVSELLDFAHRLDRLGIPMIYASSASILSTTEDSYSLVSNEMRSNTYDASKLAFDVMARALEYKVIGLRLGTVAGWSPNMRWDTLFNSMNKAAKFTGLVHASNCSNFRGVLFIEDLVAYIKHLLLQYEKDPHALSGKQVSLASWSGSIGTMAASIASYWGATVKFGPGSQTYSFVVNDRELSAVMADNELYLSIAERCERFKKLNNW